MSTDSRRDIYSPPPGQGYYSAPGANDRRTRAQQPQFDPPPRSAYDDYGTPRDAYKDDRPYAPADPRPHPMNQVAPYDYNKAGTGWERSWDEQRAYTHRPPPPPSDYDLGRKPRPNAGDRHHDRHDDRYDDDDRYHDERDRESHNRRRRRRSSEEELKEKALGYPSDPKKGGRDALGGSEGERGIAAKLIGGAGGALLGKTFGRGHTLETIAGAAVGALTATAIEKQLEKRKEEKTYVKHGRDEYASTRTGSYPQPRDIKDMRETARNSERPSMRERLRSLSRRGTRSLSRRRPDDERRRRSDSYDSVDSYRRGSSR